MIERLLRADDGMDRRDPFQDCTMIRMFARVQKLSKSRRSRHLMCCTEHFNLFYMAEYLWEHCF